MVGREIMAVKSSSRMSDFGHSNIRDKGFGAAFSGRARFLIFFIRLKVLWRGERDAMHFLEWAAANARKYDRKLQTSTEGRFIHYADHPEQIAERLAELDREWDIERDVETQAAILAVTGLLAGLIRRRFNLLALIGALVLIQQATTRWSLPFALMRRFLKRQRTEIEMERYGLKALRGDFDKLLRNNRDAGNDIGVPVMRAIRH
jgi:hypothetical protein